LVSLPKVKRNFSFVKVSFYERKVLGGEKEKGKKMNTNTMREYTGSPVEVVSAQVPLPKSQLEKLKQRSGMITTEDALQTAVNHYFSCPEISICGSGSESKREEGLVFVSGKVKKPNHGHWHGYEHETNQNRELLAIEMEIMSQVKSIRWLMF